MPNKNAFQTFNQPSLHLTCGWHVLAGGMSEYEGSNPADPKMPKLVAACAPCDTDDSCKSLDIGEMLTYLPGEFQTR